MTAHRAAEGLFPGIRRVAPATASRGMREQPDGADGAARRRSMSRQYIVRGSLHLGRLSESKPGKAALDELYDHFNRREYVHPDPVEFLHEYDDPRDREVVGIVASSLAYGRVRQILGSVGEALRRMGASPADFVRSSSPGGIRSVFEGFKHRFTTGYEVASMLIGVKRMLERHGSLEECFAFFRKNADETVLPALCAFVGELNGSSGSRSMFLPSPARGSACKRFNLFLRWMIRRDEVDPGIWTAVPASQLVVPVDTHMHRIGRALGFTERNGADLKTALEITDAFRTICPSDPVRYDFALTRIGILNENS